MEVVKISIMETARREVIILETVGVGEKQKLRWFWVTDTIALILALSIIAFYEILKESGVVK